MNAPDQVLCERRTYAADALTHAHPYAQLVVPIDGILTVSMAEGGFENARQNVVYIPAGSSHSFYSRTPNQFFVFDIPGAFLPPDAGRRPLCQPLDERWRAIRTLIGAEVGAGPASNRRVLDLFRYIAGLLEPAPSCASLEYIRAHFNRPITLRELADLEHYHPSYYSEWFQRRFGRSPLAYLRELRLEKAKSLLRETDYTIIQIAQQVGYQHHATLTRIFQEEVGLLPSEYRAKNRIPAK
jgi:AraC-like DNA-binding protein